MVNHTLCLYYFKILLVTNGKTQTKVNAKTKDSIYIQWLFFGNKEYTKN